MHDNQRRRTGRTFRTLLKALLKASEGEVVVVVASDGDYAMDLCYQTNEIANNYCIQIDGANINIGNGNIKFSGPLSRHAVYLARTKGVVILRDHYKGLK